MNTAGPEDGSIGPLREALAVCAAAGMSGVLRVTGDPGGAINLVAGRIAAIETPGAPSAEIILIRSHRVASSGWDTAFRAAAASGKRMSSELIARQMAAFYQGAPLTANGDPEHTASVSGAPAVSGLPHRQQDQRRRLRVPGQAPELRVLLGLLRLRSRQNIDASETP